MTWSIALIGLVAAVSLTHLVTTAVQALVGLCGRRSRDERLMAAGGERGDWHVFFHCADLLGRETNKKTSKRDKQLQIAGTAPTRRPRSRVSL